MTPTWFAWWASVAAIVAVWGAGYLWQSRLPPDHAGRFMPPVWVLPAAFVVSAVLVVLAE